MSIIYFINFTNKKVIRFGFLFNLELLAFMKIEDAKHYYSLVKESFPDNGNNLNSFYEYFETT